MKLRRNESKTNIRTFFGQMNHISNTRYSLGHFKIDMQH